MTTTVRSLMLLLLHWKVIIRQHRILVVLLLLLHQPLRLRRRKGMQNGVGVLTGEDRSGRSRRRRQTDRVVQLTQ